MKKLKQIITRIWMPLLLIGVAILLLWISKGYYDIDKPTGFQTAFAKFLSGLSSTIFIAGGLKFFVDLYQGNREKRAENKAFRNELLNDLRSVVDQVELSKVLIRSHQSAKTYGDCMRERVMPANIKLWEIKRSLVNQNDPFLSEVIIDIRAHIHSMIAYLSTLIEEFEKEYPSLSNLQRYQEAAQSATVKEHSSTFDTNTDRNKLVKFNNTWKIIKTLPQCNDFLFDRSLSSKRTKENALNDTTVFDSRYDEYFLSHYSACKQLVKTGKRKEQEKSSKEILGKTKVMQRFEILHNDLKVARQEDLEKGKKLDYKGDLVKMIKTAFIPRS